MITKINAYKSSDGAAHSSLGEAQRHELASLFIGSGIVEARDGTDEVLVGKVVEILQEKSDQIIDILTMKPNSLPKARKINGGKKPRKHIAEQTTMFNAETPKPAA